MLVVYKGGLQSLGLNISLVRVVEFSKNVTVTNIVNENFALC